MKRALLLSAIALLLVGCSEAPQNRIVTGYVSLLADDGSGMVLRTDDGTLEKFTLCGYSVVWEGFSGQIGLRWSHSFSVSEDNHRGCWRVDWAKPDQEKQ